MKARKGFVCVLLVLAIVFLGRISVETELLDSVFGEVDADKILIIDAGHGGFDGGAQSADGTTEQYINLCIARDLESLCGLFGEQTVLTRTSEEALDYNAGKTIHENKVADIKARQRVAEAIENGVFLSIHLNKFEQVQYYGAQTFYSRNHSDSQLYAESIQEALIDGLNNGNTRKAKSAPETVYLMKRLSCPALIVECGFLSNPEEAALLRNPEYQKKVALCILDGYLGA